MRFHVIGLPHTQTHRRHCACAYTMKVLNFCRMMKSLGHEVVHYGAEGSQVECDEHVQTISLAEQLLLIGPHDYRRHTYSVPWDHELPHWQLANSRTIVELLRRAQQRDFLCLIGGGAQKPIADAVTRAGVLPVEFGIGYTGTFAPYRVFESYAHMHTLYGAAHPSGDTDGRFCDCVIPNYYDPEDFPAGEGRGGYFLYIGRLIRRKGIQIAVDTAGQLGARLLVAGQGCKETQPGRIVADDGSVYEAEGLEYAGFADIRRRAQLMGAARAVFVPTLYLEPFGGVNAEAQFCGTPVITTDWGAFPETVEQARTGYRCRTLRQFVDAAQNVDRLNRHYIRTRAQQRWSMWNIRHRYQAYFEQLYDLWDAGWYSLPDDLKPFN